MKKNQESQQKPKRITVTFRPSYTSILKNQIAEQQQVFTGRSKRNKYPSLVRFKKLDVCSQETNSQQNPTNKQLSQKDQKFTQKQIFKGRSKNKNFTQYKAQRQSFYDRSTQKKKTMIPIKIRLDKSSQSQRSFVSRRTFKSISKVVQNKQIENLSLKSLNKNYSKLKRQASSLWSIPTNKFINHNLNNSPTKILHKQQKQLVLLEIQFRNILKMCQQEQQKKIILFQLIQTIKQQILYKFQNQQQMSKTNDQKTLQTFLFTQIPSNTQNDQKRKNKFERIPIDGEKQILQIQQQNKITNLDKQINKIIKQHNLLKSKIAQMKQQILSVRKDRVIFSSLFKNIQKQLKNETNKFMSALVYNRNILGLTIDVQVGSKQQKLKTILLKRYYEINNFDGQDQVKNKDKTPMPSQNNLYKLKKQQSGIEDTKYLIQNYNSFSLANFSSHSIEREQRFNKINEMKIKALLVKPRKQVSSHHYSQKKSISTIQMQQKQRIQQLKKMIQYMGVKLEVKRNQCIKNGSKDKNYFNTSIKFLPSYLTINDNKQPVKKQKSLTKDKDKQMSQQMSQNKHFSPLKKNQFILDKQKSMQINKFIQPVTSNQLSQTQSITQQIICKFNSLQQSNELYCKKISQKDKEIFLIEEKIDHERKLKLKKINEVLFKQQEQLRNSEQIERKQYDISIKKIYERLCEQLIAQKYQDQKQQKTPEKDQNDLLKFVQNLSTYYAQTKLKTPQAGDSLIKQKSQEQSQNRFSSQISSSVENSSGLFFKQKSNIRNHNLFKPFDINTSKVVNIQGKKDKSKNILTKRYLQLKSQESQNTNIKAALAKGLGVQQSILNKNQSKKCIPLIANPSVRHSKGLSTLITNMQIFQSYQKAMSRQDFQNQYRKQVLFGRKKKKTLIRKPLMNIS